MTRPASGRRVNRRGEGERLRGELVEAACRLLERLDGEESLSLRAVTREAGVAPQSFYLHFPDKQALMRAVYEARYAELTAGMRDALAQLDSTAPPTERVGAIARAYCRFGLTRPAEYRVLFGTLGTSGWDPETLPGLVAFQLFRDELAGCVASDADEVTVCLWASLHGLVTLRVNRPSFAWPPIDDLIDRTVAAYAGG
ncbi:WHG domain-containing protein [Pseudonocardia sp. DSM 110487]|uniref:TetR/AcrR family transcriptional regulator n=1 Tax=Pseudonocardia sp. DSM 110487 TaxID=2865833 RepID=UPI001C6A07BB|nr:TetR-like C-terminal domain-containing protein [Pseudonocardia sp. DSM 110487]QYN36484.1 WHG domain-containing protein [Pseudonocardia sp. DSM 110487]